jgi:hypothetical protein
MDGLAKTGDPFRLSRFWLQWPVSALYTPEPKTGPPRFPASGSPEETS